MAIALVTSSKGRSLFSPVATGNQDSSGANFLFAGIGSGSGLDTGTGTETDSKSNSWSAVTVRDSGGQVKTRGYYSSPSSVGASHNATYTNGAGVIAAAMVLASFSGVKASSPFDQENGATATSVLSLATGSITPTEDNELILTWVSASPTIPSSSFSIDNGFTIIDGYDGLGGTNEALWLAYKIQTAAAAINPMWSWVGNGGDGYAAGIASFKAAPAIFIPQGRMMPQLLAQ